MANDTEQLSYPRGQMSMGPGGRLLQVTDVRATVSNSASNQHTLAKTPSGTFTGNRECAGSFSCIVDEKGLERTYFEAVKSGRRQQARVEIPKVGIVFDVVIGSVDMALNTNGPVAVSVSWVGKLITQVPRT
jgi:hypothetical protein